MAVACRRPTELVTTGSGVGGPVVGWSLPSAEEAAAGGAVRAGHPAPHDPAARHPPHGNAYLLHHLRHPQYEYGTLRDV